MYRCYVFEIFFEKLPYFDIFYLNFYINCISLFRTAVRLGEWDTNSDNDCDNGDCSEPVVDVTVEELLSHENYNSNSKAQENDIALIRLSRDVEFTGECVFKICREFQNINTFYYIYRFYQANLFANKSNVARNEL